jgi:hypothetical protein
VVSVAIAAGPFAIGGGEDAAPEAIPNNNRIALRGRATV